MHSLGSSHADALALAVGHTVEIERDKRECEPGPIENHATQEHHLARNRSDRRALHKLGNAGHCSRVDRNLAEVSQRLNR